MRGLVAAVMQPLGSRRSSRRGVRLLKRPAPRAPAVPARRQLPVVRYDPKAGQRSLDMLRWGLIPYWAKDIKVGFANANAKAEGIENKPAFLQSVRAPALPGAGRQLL